MPPKGKGKRKASPAPEPRQTARARRTLPDSDDERVASRSGAASPIGGGDRPMRGVVQRRGSDDDDVRDDHEEQVEANPRAMARGVTQRVEVNPHAMARGVTQPGTK